MSQLFSLNTMPAVVKEHKGQLRSFLPSYLACHPGGRALKYLILGKSMKKMLPGGINEMWPGRYPIFVFLRGQKVSPRGRWKVYTLGQRRVEMKYTDILPILQRLSG